MVVNRRFVQASTVVLSTLLATTSYAQASLPAANTSLLQESLHKSVLTQGHQPFHVVLEIAPDETPRPNARHAPAYMHATVELFWAGPDRYKLVLTSPSFNQTRIVEGAQIEEHDDSDFYPRWLDDFVRMLIDPVPHQQLAELMQRRLTGKTQIFGTMRGSQTFDSRQIAVPRCLETSNRPGGITDETSVARICFDASDPWYQSTLTFTHYVSFSDYKKFAGQNIPRAWTDDIPENIFVLGKVTALDKLSKPEADSIHASTPTPPSDRLQTVFLSRSDIQARVIAIPDFEWPDENTEALEGYMILYVRTDRAGNITESYWDSSDNYKLQDAGVQLALKIKLKPLLVDGIPAQMEGPLVLHFKTHRSDPAVPSKQPFAPACALLPN